MDEIFVETATLALDEETLLGVPLSGLTMEVVLVSLEELTNLLLIGLLTDTLAVDLDILTEVK